MTRKSNYIILVGILGTAFEWLEYSYYGYLTTKMSRLFFPNYDSRAGLLATMGVFAAGFLMRPIGGIIFGYLGDKKGRKFSLSFSLFLMGLATLSMGLLPTYETIGIYAPLFLLLCRLLQGLAVSGEFNGAAIFLIEHNKNAYPNLAGSWVGTASALGMLMGAFAATLVSFSNMPTWAWRIPFFFAFFSCMIANYLRNKLLESPLFLNIDRNNQLVKFPIKEIFKHYKKSFLYNLILAAFVSVYIYVCNVYYVSFLIKHCHYPSGVATTVAAVGELSVVIFFPVSAILSDKFGYKNVMLLGLISSSLVPPLVFTAGEMGSILFIIVGQIFYAVGNALACAPIFNFIYNLFPTNIRYSGNAISWSLGAAIFGSMAPIISEFYMSRQIISGPCFYVMFFILLSIFVVLRSQKYREKTNTQVAQGSYL